jgi:hypothetical protein
MPTPGFHKRLSKLGMRLPNPRIRRQPKGKLPAEPPDSTLHGDVGGRAVPRFFFQVLREGWELDPVPEVLPEAATALAKARAIARELLADAEGEWLSARIEVADEHGNVVGIVQVSDFRIQ